MRTWWWLCKTFKRYKTEGPFLCAKKNLHLNMPYLVGLMLVCLLLLASLPMPACYWCCLPSSVFIKLCYTYLCLLKIWHRIFTQTTAWHDKRTNTYLIVFPLLWEQLQFFPKKQPFNKKFFDCLELFCWCDFFLLWQNIFYVVVLLWWEARGKKNSNFEHGKKWFWNMIDDVAKKCKKRLEKNLDGWTTY